MIVKYEDAPAQWVEAEVHHMFTEVGVKFYVLRKLHPGRSIFVVREHSQIRWPDAN